MSGREEELVAGMLIERLKPNVVVNGTLFPDPVQIILVVSAHWGCTK